MLLTACTGGANSVVYNLEMDTDDADTKSELAFAATRVIERRLESMGEASENVDIQKQGQAVQVLVEVANEDVAELLTGELTEPFSLQIMEATDIAEADIVVGNEDGYKATGITKEHVEWLLAEEEANQKGRVTIIFTADGREKMQALFKEKVGEYIGLFVRDRLIAKLLVDTDEMKDDIIISEIPSPALAETFADDVNVGLHVLFSRAQ